MLRDLAASVIAARQRHRGDAAIGDQRGDRRRSDESRGEQTAWKAGVAEDLLDRERAARHVGRVLEHRGVARHQRRRGETEDLPERKIPRHHREDDAERIEAHVAARGVGLARLLGKKRLGVIRIVFARPRALLDLGLALDDRLTHLQRHQPRVVELARPQDGRGLAHILGARGVTRVALGLRFGLECCLACGFFFPFPRDPGGPYGPGAVGISAFSPVLTGWTQGGPIAIHGTNEPWSIGRAVSNGCIRMPNPVLRKLFAQTPSGTPVLIRR